MHQIGQINSMNINTRPPFKPHKLKYSQKVALMNDYNLVDEYGDRVYSTDKLLKKYKISIATLYRYQKEMLSK